MNPFNFGRKSRTLLALEAIFNSIAQMHGARTSGNYYATPYLRKHGLSSFKRSPEAIRETIRLAHEKRERKNAKRLADWQFVRGAKIGRLEVATKN